MESVDSGYVCNCQVSDDAHGLVCRLVMSAELSEVFGGNRDEEVRLQYSIEERAWHVAFHAAPCLPDNTHTRPRMIRWPCVVFDRGIAQPRQVECKFPPMHMNSVSIAIFSCEIRVFKKPHSRDALGLHPRSPNHRLNLVASRFLLMVLDEKY